MRRYNIHKYNNKPSYALFNLRHNLVQPGLVVLWVCLQPFHCCIVHLCLWVDIEIAGGQQSAQVLRRHACEILTLHYLSEVFTGVTVSHVHQVHTIVAFSKGSNCKAVGGVKVGLHVLTAGSRHQLHLTDSGSNEVSLHILSAHSKLKFCPVD